MTPQDAALLASMTGFTPGPWTVDGICIANVSGYPIDICLMGEPLQYPGDTGKMMDNSGPNAALIAAAPDLHRIATEQAAEIARLLEALEAIRQYGNDTLSGPSVASEDTRNWQRESVLEMTKRAANAIEAAT